MLPNNNERFNYKTCDAKFHENKKFHEHIGSMHPNPTECTLCTQTFQFNNLLEDHLVRDYKQRKMYECRECSFCNEMEIRETHGWTHAS